MIIPTGMRYTATVTGSAWKPVTCEACGEQYAYKVTRKVSGTGRSALFLDNAGAQERARQGAYSGLDRALETASAPVPCPRCQRFHSSMFPTLAGKRYEGLLILGILALVAGLLTLVLYVGAALIALAIGLFIWRGSLKKQYDPNADLERATKAAQPLPPVMRRTEYEQLIKEAVAKGMDRSQLQDIRWTGEAKASSGGVMPGPAGAGAPATSGAARPAAPSGDGTGFLAGGIVLMLFAGLPMLGSLVMLAMPHPTTNPLYGGVCGGVNILLFGVPAGFCFRAWAKRRSDRSPNWLIAVPALLVLLLPAVGGLRYALLSPEDRQAIAEKETESSHNPAPAPVAIKSPAAPASAEVGVGEGEATELAFQIDKVSEHQRPTQRAPWHEKGGEWTFLDCTTEGAAPAHFTVGVMSKGTSGPIGWGKARLSFDDAAAGDRFVRAFAAAFHTPPPAAKKRLRAEPLEMGTAELGHGMEKTPGGGFGGDGHGTWAATKWFPQRGSLEGEVFFNYSLADKRGEFSEKDSSYREDLVALFSGASQTASR